MPILWDRTRENVGNAYPSEQNAYSHVLSLANAHITGVLPINAH